MEKNQEVLKIMQNFYSIIPHGDRPFHLRIDTGESVMYMLRFWLVTEVSPFKDNDGMLAAVLAHYWAQGRMLRTLIPKSRRHGRQSVRKYEWNGYYLPNSGYYYNDIGMPKRATTAHSSGRSSRKNAKTQRRLKRFRIVDKHADALFRSLALKCHKFHLPEDILFLIASFLV